MFKIILRIVKLILEKRNKNESGKKGYLLNPCAYDMKNNILYGRKDKFITNETIESKAQEFITLYQEEFTGIYSYLQNELNNQMYYLE